MPANPVMVALVSGALVMGYGIAGLFFLRFWRQSRDRLFAFFSAAFWILSAQRFLLTLSAAPNEAVWLYGLRFLAFALILIAILDKNRPGAE
jgi:hypothetical protein